MALKGNNQKSLTISEVTVGRILSHYLWNSSAPPKPETMETAATDAARTAVKIDAADYVKNSGTEMFFQTAFYDKETICAVKNSNPCFS